MKRIAIIDPHTLFRVAIKGIIAEDETLRVVAEGDECNHLIPVFNKFKPDLIITEVDGNNPFFFRDISLLIQDNPQLKIMTLTLNPPMEYVTDALKAGIKGILHKSMKSEEIIQTLHNILDDGSYLHPTVQPYVVADYSRLANEYYEGAFKNQSVVPPYHLLTRRECEILQLMAEGKSNADMSDYLFISASTVKNHVSKILEKMNVKDRVNAVLIAIKNRWVYLK